MLHLNLVLSLCQAGLFSSTVATLIVQVIQSNQPNPADVTNVLLLRILQQNTSFDGADPLAPPVRLPLSASVAQCILFGCLIFIFVVAMTAVVAKRLIYSHAQGSKWGAGGEEWKKFRHLFLELGNRGLYHVLTLLGATLESVLLNFIIGLAIFLWDFNFASAATVLAVTVLAFLCFFSVFGFLMQLVPSGSGSRVIRPRRSLEGVDNEPSPMTLSNPDLWRKHPLFTPSPPKDIFSFAGAWLLEKGGDFSTTTAVAAMFSEFQWPLNNPCTTALIHLRDTYEQCFRAPKFDTSRLNALQSAAAYYVLYRIQLVREASMNTSIWEGKGNLSTDIPPDLFLHEHTEEWGGEGVFEYLLHTKDRSDPVTSARFLSYVAPYWFCGHSDSSIQSRPSRLEKVHELIDVLDKSEAFTPATLTNCVLCVGAAMDFPLHPGDLVRVDKRFVRSSGRRW